LTSVNKRDESAVKFILIFGESDFV